MVEGAQPLAQLDVQATIAQCSIDDPIGCTLVALVDLLFIFPTILQQHGDKHTQPTNGGKRESHGQLSH